MGVTFLYCYIICIDIAFYIIIIFCIDITFYMIDITFLFYIHIIYRYIFLLYYIIFILCIDITFYLLSRQFYFDKCGSSLVIKVYMYLQFFIPYVYGLLW